jgi:hypothetical protein
MGRARILSFISGSSAQPGFCQGVTLRHKLSPDAGTAGSCMKITLLQNYDISGAGEITAASASA